MGKILLNGVEYSSTANNGVTGIKGNNENEYRTGDVNLTPENIGAINKNGDSVTGEVLFNGGTMVSRQAGVEGTDGYVNIARIKITSAYINYPLIFEIAGRGWSYSRKLYVYFGNSNDLDPNLNSFLIDNTIPFDVSIVKSETSTWDIYMQKYDGWSFCDICALHKAVNITITYPNTQVSSLPSEARKPEIIKWSKAADSDTVDGKHASDFVNKSGDTMTGTLTSSKTTIAHIDGNRGITIINSTAKAGNYTMLDKLNSTNGYFTDGVWEGKRVFFYTPKSTVDSHINEIKYQLILLDESGNSNFPGLISASRGSFKGDIIVTSNKSDTKSLTVPCSGRIDEGINYVQHLSEHKTFIGSFADINKVWWNVISVRHANGWNDGHYFGMYLRSQLTETGSHGGSLLWNKQMGNEKGWLGERVLLDSQNYKDFCLPLDGGIMNLNSKIEIPCTSYNDGEISINGDDYSTKIYAGTINTQMTPDDIYSEKRSILDESGLSLFVTNIDPDDDNYTHTARLRADNYWNYGLILECNGYDPIKFINDGSGGAQIEGDNSIYLNLSYDNAGVMLTESGGFFPTASWYDLGRNNNNNKWRNIYATNGTIQTSDRTRKTDITNLETQKVQAFINGLNPVSYKMIDGTSGRTHYGFIAQDIEELMNTLNMDSKDFAGFIKSPKKVIKYEDENGNKLKKPVEEIIEGEYDYSLRYDEFIAPLIKVVQEQQKAIENQQQQITQLKNALENANL